MGPCKFHKLLPGLGNLFIIEFIQAVIVGIGLVDKSLVVAG